LRNAKSVLLETAPLVKPSKSYEADDSELRELREELGYTPEQLAVGYGGCGYRAI